MITLHCPCGRTIRTELGPSAVSCKCGKSHRLPPIGPPARPSAPAPAPAAAPGAPAPPPPSTATAVAPPPPQVRIAHRPHHDAIHDGPPLHPEPQGFAAFIRTPAAAGAASVLVILLALLAAVVLRTRAERLKREAESGPGAGTECSFIGTGIAFTAPATWKLTKKENLTFEFAAPEGTIAVTVLQVTQESHADRLRATEPNAGWSPGTSELGDAEFMSASWTGARGPTEGDSWWFDRKTHRLWIYATGNPGVRAALKPLFEHLNLNAPLEAPK